MSHEKDSIKNTVKVIMGKDAKLAAIRQHIKNMSGTRVSRPLFCFFLVVSWSEREWRPRSNCDARMPTCWRGSTRPSGRGV